MIEMEKLKRISIAHNNAVKSAQRLAVAAHVTRTYARGTRTYARLETIYENAEKKFEAALTALLD